MSVESIIGYIKSFGTWAILISFFLMMCNDPAIALLQERIAPCHQPNTAAFANVIKNAGNGASILLESLEEISLRS
jgi:hypothetical protein